MSIFLIEDTNELLENLRDPSDWIDLGVEFKLAQKEGATLFQFARRRGLDETTFKQALRRYERPIRNALVQSTLTESKRGGKNKKKNRKKDLIDDFRGQIRQASVGGGAKQNNKSQKWFKEVVKTSVRGFKRSRPVVGRIYAYAYDAKHKDTLPYWDRYPLMVFLGFKKSKNGNTLMLGLNLHYIPPRARQAFLEELIVHANTDRLTNKTSLKINWGKVKNMRGANHMIKAYLPNHVMGSMTEVKPKDWINVIYMPLQSFRSQGKRFSTNKVWRDF